MDRSMRWVISILVVAAIVALVAFARGGAERGNPDTSTAMAIVVPIAGYGGDDSRARLGA
jgi:hypothetical protein